ncbi:MAG: hypothetical protein Q7T20_09845 [Saprospiraceae bacterium]|nr:hypothetical protein [Saprospiraceae bacterium]
MSELRDTIQYMESKQAEEGQLLKAQFHLTSEAIRPINLLKSAFGQSTALEDTKESLLSTSAGLTAGYFSKLLFVRNSHNPIRKLLGTALLFGVTNIISKNPGPVSFIGRTIWNFFRRKPNVETIEIVNKEKSY